MTDLNPEIARNESALLAVGDGNTVFWSFGGGIAPRHERAINSEIVRTTQRLAAHL
jgi:hypothetical protein